jgi:hypothetical protein
MPSVGSDAGSVPDGRPTLEAVKRSLVVVFVAGTFCLLTSAAYDREWPSYTDSAVGWLGLFAGWIVIAVVGAWAERWYEARRAQR